MKNTRTETEKVTDYARMIGKTFTLRQAVEDTGVCYETLRGIIRGLERREVVECVRLLGNVKVYARRERQELRVPAVKQRLGTVPHGIDVAELSRRTGISQDSIVHAMDRPQASASDHVDEIRRVILRRLEAGQRMPLITLARGLDMDVYDTIESMIRNRELILTDGMVGVA